MVDTCLDVAHPKVRPFVSRRDHISSDRKLCDVSPMLEKWVKDANVQPTMTDSGLMQFPNELLLNVLESCPAFGDKVCFALTCRRTLAISLDHLETLKRKLAAPWAGERLICVGDYGEWKHLPHGVLTSAERREFEALHAKGDYDVRSYGGFGFMRETTTELFDGDFRKDKALERVVKNIRGEDAKRFLALYRPSYPVRGDWVLCNLTKGLVVRASTIAALTMKKGADKTSPFMMRAEQDLGHVVLSLLYAPSGAWMGNKFCVTTLDRMPPLENGKEWRDASKAMARVVKEMCDY